MSECVLIAEDDLLTASFIKEILGTRGLRVSGVASDFDSALNMANSCKPDIALIDINLNGEMEGITLAKEIVKCYNIPFIYVTAYSDKHTLQIAKMTCPNGYLLKPINPNELLLTIDLALYKHKSELKIRKSEERYRLLAENSTDVIWTMTMEGHFSYVSPSVTAMTGYSPEEAIKIAPDKFLVPGSMVHSMEILAKEPQKPPEKRSSSIIFDLQLYKKNGQIIDIESTVSFIFDKEGKPAGLQGSTRDITKRKLMENELIEHRLHLEGLVDKRTAEFREINNQLQYVIGRMRNTEESLRNSGEKFRTMIEQSTEVIAVIDEEGVLQYNSQPIERLFGYSPYELIGKYILEIVHDDDKNRVRSDFSDILQNKGRISFSEFRIQHKNGSWRIVESVFNNLLDNQLIGGILINLRDITDRVEASEALRISEEKYRNLVENLNDAVYTIDRNANILYISPNVSAMSGYSPDELVGESYARFLHPDEDLAERAGDLQKVLSGESLTNEYRFTAKDGRTIWVRNSGRPMYYNGEIIGVQGILSDITNRKLSEKELERYRNQLEEMVGERTIKLKKEISERKKTEAALEMAKIEWENTFNAMHDWVCMLDLGKKIIRTNIIGEKFTGKDIKTLQGNTCCNLIHGNDEPIQDCPMNTMLKTGKRETLELHIPSMDQTLMITVDPVKDESGNIAGAVHIIRDITVRKHAEDALKLNQKRLEQAQRIAQMGCFEIQLPSGKTFFSEEIYRIFGYEKDCAKLDSKKFFHHFHPDDRALFITEIMMAKSGKNFKAEHEVNILTKDFEQKTLNVQTEIEFDKSGNQKMIIGTLQDITERKMVEKRIISAIDEERKRIARDLHDGLGQKLTGLSFMVGSLKAKIAKRIDPDPEVIDLVLNLIKETTSESQAFSRGEFPASTEENDLNKVIRKMSENIKKTFGINCFVDSTGKVVVNDIENLSHIYFIISEAINNSIKHGKAKNIFISIKSMDKTLVITIKDDGVGKITSKPDDDFSTGIGLKSMKYRANLLGAELNTGFDGENGYIVKIKIQDQSLLMSG